jgi:ribonuclease BN (tRNA processing enzyme)
MNIKLYDIGRADCVLLSDHNRNLLIDCGVKKDDISNSMDINNDLSYSENHLLITHYHDDHIRGLDHIYGDVFDKIYISRFPLCLFNVVSKDALKKFIKLYAYTPSKTKMNIYLKNILKLFKKLSKVVKKQGTIQLLNKGDRFSHVDKFTVLHPDLSCESLVPEELLSLADTYIKIMEQAMDKTAVKKINQLANEYSKTVNGLELNEEVNEFQLNEVLSKELIRSLDKVLYNIKQVKKGIMEYQDFDSINKAFGKYMNNNSLVIHNENILFTGDVTRSVIASLHTKEEFHESYKVIKIPFHGSNGHYSMNLPYADFLLSCSDSIIWDINEDSQYLNLLLKSMTVFSNGDVFHNGHIFHKFYDGQIKINL